MTKLHTAPFLKEEQKNLNRELNLFRDKNISSSASGFASFATQEGNNLIINNTIYTQYLKKKKIVPLFCNGGDKVSSPLPFLEIKNSSLPTKSKGGEIGMVPYWHKEENKDKLFNKGLNLYNLSLNNYLKNKNYNYLKLLFNLEFVLNSLSIHIKKGRDVEYYKLNLIYNNYLYLLNKYLPIYNLYLIVYNNLYFKDRISKYTSIYLNYRYRKLQFKYKLNKYNLYTSSSPFYLLGKKGSLPFKNIEGKLGNGIKKVTLHNIFIWKLLEKGNILYLDIINLILKKKFIINNYKLNNLFNYPINRNNNSLNKYINTNVYFGNGNFTSIPQLQELESSLNDRDGSKGIENTNIGKKINDLYLKYRGKKLNLDLIFNLDKLQKNNLIKINNTNKQINNYSLNSYKEYLYKDQNNTNILYNNFKNNSIIQYLQGMNIFLKNKGIFIQYNKITAYNFKYNYKLFTNIYKLLFSSFKSIYSLISKPMFIITPDKVIIHIFYYIFLPNLMKLKQINLYKNAPSSPPFFYPYGEGNEGIKKVKSFFYKELKLNRKFKKQITKYRRLKNKGGQINLFNLSSLNYTKLFSNKFKILCNILSNLFKKPVELNLTRLHYPYLDSNILVNLLGIMINKIKLRIIVRKLFANTIIKKLNNLYIKKNNSKIIPAFLTGINIRVAGRLYTQKIIPRKTVKTIIKGAYARSKVNYLDYAVYKNKNKRGAFSITIKNGVNYFK